MILCLENGLEALIAENPSSPLVTVQGWIKAGSAAEQEDQHGVSHLLEHLFLSRLERQSPALHELEQSGALINGQTSKEHTVYSITAQSGQLPLSLQVLTELLSASFWHEALLEQEKAVISRELEMRQSDPSWQLQEGLLSRIWAHSSYAHPILGTQASLAQLGQQELERYYRRYYTPDRLLLVIVGAPSYEQAANLVVQKFSRFARSRHTDEPDVQSAVPATVFAHYHLQRGASLHSVAGMVDSDRSLERQIVAEAAAELVSKTFGGTLERMMTHAGGLSTLGWSTQASRVSANTPLSLPEWLANIQLTQEKWESLTQQLSQSYAKKRERSESKAYHLGQMWRYYGQIDSFDLYRQRLRQITPEQVAQYLEEWRQAAETRPAPSVLFQEKLPTVKSAPLTHRTLLPDQSRLLVHTIADSPMTCLIAAFPNRSIPQWHRFPAAPHALSLYWANGLQRSGFDGRDSTFTRMEAAVLPFVREDCFGVQINVLSEHLGTVIAAMSHFLHSPGFPHAVWPSVQQALFKQLQTSAESLFAQMQRAAHATMFRGHVYEHALYGRSEFASQLDYEHVAENGRTAFASPAVISVYGGDPGFDIAQRFMTLWRAQSSQSACPVQESAFPAFGEQPARLHYGTHGQQAHVLLQVPGVPFASPDKFALHVIGSLLTGKGGRLFHRLRGEQQLAYSFTVFSKEFLEGGYATGYAVCPRENLETVERLLLEEWEQLAEQRIDEGELRRAQERLINTFHIKGQAMTSKASMLLLYELAGAQQNACSGLLPYAEQIRAVTREEVQQAARRYLLSDRRVTVVLTPVG